MNMTLIDYERVCKGHFARLENDWEQTRMIYSILYNSNVKKGSQKKLHELIPLKKDDEYRKQRLEKAKKAKEIFKTLPKKKNG